jgi:outer membrane receptor protein involved in Fe transport
MLRKIYLTLVCIAFSIASYAQSGGLQGTISDAKTNETLPATTVSVELNGAQAGASQTDIDGQYSIKPLVPGKYTIKVSLVGYAKQEIKGVVVSADKVTYVDIKLVPGVELNEVIVTDYKVPLISKDNLSSGSTVTREDIVTAPTRDVTAVAANTAGVSQIDNGRDVNIRGSRSDATAYYIDGIKVRGGSRRLPQAGVEQVTVITGGLPAQYGDATGGVISITTRGPSKTFNGGVEAVTSQLTDAYGYNVLSANLSGPLYTRKGESQPVLGFLVAAEFQSEKDPNPSANPLYKIKDEKLNFLRENPYIIQPSGGALRNSEFITMNDLEPIKAKQNAAGRSLAVNSKVDFKPSLNTTLTFGANFNYVNQRDFSLRRALFSPEHNSQYIENTWRGFARFTQKFGSSATDDKAAATIKNAFYSIQVDYSNTGALRQNPEHKENLFNYGYIGKFKTHKTYGYGFADPTQNGPGDTLKVISHDVDTLMTFTPSDLNPDQANYTRQIYASGQNITNYPFLRFYQGLGNGDSPQAVYSLFFNTGTTHGGFAKSNQQQVRIAAQGSADIKKHAVVFGVEYEQRTDRAWSVNATGLWGLMRNMTNNHLSEVDTFRTGVTSIDLGGTTFPVILYDRRYDALSQTIFDKRLRQSLGKPVDGREWLDIDNMSPETFNLNLFSADELLNQGSGNYLGDYYGYDYTGKKISSKQSFEKFFTDSLNRTIGAFQPNYIAGFIQDRFTFKDLIFNIGLRIDRYDANQKVLKDKYLLFDARTANDPQVAALLASNNLSRPGNIGDDYVVYVDDYANPGRVLGYRSGDDWYDVSGTKVLNSDVLTQGTTKINPFLTNPDDYKNKNINTNVFKDYEPQFNLMPRVSFSFPISDEALFFAHYDVLTQRPPSAFSRVIPYEYLYMESNVTNGNLFNNPDLKPQRTTDYELGFRQKVSNSSAFSISAFYKEERNLFTTAWVINAFPTSYQVFVNRDFATTKGLNFSYDLRRTNNVRMTAAYTLQFATGTGSAIGSAANLSKSDPDLRTPIFLNFDQRHQLSTSVDYRYESGTDYNGPVLYGFKLFEGTGLNVIAKASSGTPYTKRTNPTKTATFGERAGSSQIAGTLNGARLPWVFRIDARLDRDINLKFGRKGDDKKDAYLNVYILVQNLLDARNVLSVYPYTGSPVDDGYISSPIGAQEVASKVSTQSFADLYSVKQSGPGNEAGAGYSIPRIIRLGASLNF